MPDESFIQRLAFIRYLYSMAVEQSRQPEPIGAVSILTFHDSVELFLQLAYQHLNVGTEKNIPFMKYFDVMEPKLAGAKLVQKVSMGRLNNARVSLKHHGTLPATQSIEEFRASVTNFFEENTPLVFGLEFGSISMANLVKCAEARSSLEEANRLIQEGKTNDAMDKIALAFAQLVGDYEERGRTRYGHSPFNFGESLTFESAFLMGIDDRNLGKFVDKVKDSIEALRTAVKSLSLGLDYRRHVKFRRLTPHVIRFIGGDRYEVVNIGRNEVLSLSIGDHQEVVKLGRSEPLSIEECRFCYDFVIESAIRLQEFEIGIEK